MTWEQVGALIVTILVAAFWQNQRFEDLHKRIDTLETGFHKRIDDLRSEMRTGFAEIRTDIRALAESLRART